jgi:PhnB protein
LKDGFAFAVHLSFNGNCKQAFNHYQICFGGELTVQTLADTPHGTGMSKEMRKMVLWATLRNEYFKLAGSDLLDESNIVTGSSISILIECSTFTERTRLINKLTGRNFCSMENTNPLVSVIDIYSTSWLLSVH